MAADMGSAIRDRNIEMQMKQMKALSEPKNRTSSSNWSWDVNALQCVDNAHSLPTSDRSKCCWCRCCCCHWTTRHMLHFAVEVGREQSSLLLTPEMMLNIYVLQHWLWFYYLYLAVDTVVALVHLRVYHLLCVCLRICVCLHTKRRRRRAENENPKRSVFLSRHTSCLP